MSQVQANEVSNEVAAPKAKNKRFLVILIVLVAAGTIFGVSKYIHAQHHQETDDAQIEAAISPVIPRIQGFVKEIRVKDNQMVKKGDTLIILDNSDQKIAVAQMEAALAAAEGNLGVAKATSSAAHANIGSSKANISSINAQIESAKVNLWRAQQDFDRYANLVKDHSITQQQYEQALAAKQNAEHQLQVLNDQKKVATEQSNATASQSTATEQQVHVVNANIQQKQADVENAKLNLSYTVIVAPEDGFVSKINIQIGQLLQAGQSLFSIVLDANPWVVANFKETQIGKMKEGQKVIVHIDALPDHEFQAKLTSFSPATGARFALLPPDNASGNFVKVVQRIPVKIEFDANDPLVKNLRPGMNVVVDVNID